MKTAQQILSHPIVQALLADRNLLRQQIGALPPSPAGECTAIAELRDLLFDEYIGEVPVDESPITPRGMEIDQLFLDLIEFEYGSTYSKNG